MREKLNFQGNLENCPFCGDNDINVYLDDKNGGFITIVCDCCGISTKPISLYNTNTNTAIERAIRLWNKRQKSTIGAYSSQLTEIRNQQNKIGKILWDKLSEIQNMINLSNDNTFAETNYTTIQEEILKDKYKNDNK